MDNAYLSARVPVTLRNEFKSLAARRGMSIQELLREVVADCVDGEVPQPPSAERVVEILRRSRADLEKAGIVHLALFGSVARGESRPSSDIDLVAEFGDGETPGLIRIGSLENRIRDLLGGGHAVDLVPQQKLKAAARETALKDAIRIF